MLIYSCLWFLYLPIEIVCYLLLIQRSFCDWVGWKYSAVQNGNESFSQPSPVPEQLWTWSGFLKRIAGLSQQIVNSEFFKTIDVWNLKWRAKWAGVNANGLSLEEQNKRWDRFQNRSQKFWVAWGLFILVLTILGIEKIIAYNNLSPQNDLSQPGQMIPVRVGNYYSH